MGGSRQCGGYQKRRLNRVVGRVPQVKETAAKETGEKRKRGRPKKTDGAPAEKRKRGRPKKEANAKAPKKPKAPKQPKEPKAKKQKLEKVALDNTTRDDSKLMNLRRICRWLEGGDNLGNLVCNSPTIFPTICHVKRCAHLLWSRSLCPPAALLLPFVCPTESVLRRPRGGQGWRQASVEK